MTGIAKLDDHTLQKVSFLSIVFVACSLLSHLCTRHLGQIPSSLCTTQTPFNTSSALLISSAFLNYPPMLRSSGFCSALHPCISHLAFSASISPRAWLFSAQPNFLSFFTALFSIICRLFSSHIHLAAGLWLTLELESITSSFTNHYNVFPR